jgi:hypothetical protein
MARWKIVAILLGLCFVLLMIGNSRNDVLEIHNNGATMCLECIGLE